MKRTDNLFYFFSDSGAPKRSGAQRNFPNFPHFDESVGSIVVVRAPPVEAGAEP